MHSPIAATALLEPIPHNPIHPKAASRFPAAFRALFRFPTRTVRKSQEVVILVTIEVCLMVDTDDRQWGRHTRDHRNRENGKKSRRPYASCRSVARRLHRRPSSMRCCAWFASAGIAVGECCAHGMNRNPRYEAREEQS